MKSRRTEKINGYVEAKTVLKGTASEHKGVVIKTTDGAQLRLQRIGGNPFSDPVTESLTGREVALEGFRLDGVFRFNKICNAQEPRKGRPQTRSVISRRK